MSLRKTVFWLHLTCGLAAGMGILIMSGTGAILSFEPQLVAWTERSVRTVIPAPGAAPLSPAAILAAAQKARPETRATGLTLSSDPAVSAAVMFGRSGVRYINPYTGETLGGFSRLHDVLHDVEDIHRWLGSREHGRPVTGVCNLLFFGLALSGLFLWWPRDGSRRALRSATLMSFKGHGKARLWNWHNAIGFWSAPVLIVVTLTGTVMSYA